MSVFNSPNSTSSQQYLFTLCKLTKSPFSSLTCSLTALPADVAVMPSAFTLISCNSASPVVEPSGSEVIVSILDFNVSSVSFALLISLVKLLFLQYS